MSRRTKYSEKFKSLNRIPMPVFITDTDGIVQYKNNLSASNYTFRVGSNVFIFADSDDAETVRALGSKGVVSTVVLRCDAWSCVCIVIPKEVDGEKFLVFSSIPYSYDFTDVISSVKIRNRREKENYFVSLEKQIDSVLSATENEISDISESELLKLKNNAVKLMRLEKRLRERLFYAKDVPIYGTVLQTSHTSSKSVELCSFTARMTKNVSSLSAVVGFNLVYVPMRSFSICRCNSYDLARMFIYLSVFCLKFGEKTDVSVLVEEDENGSVMVFKPWISLETFARLAAFDMEYISACAGRLSYSVETENNGNFVDCLKLRIPSEINENVNIMSAESYLFDVPEDFIRRIYSEADTFIGKP